MANNKLLHFKTKNRFEQAIQNDEIPEGSIAFIQEGTDVYTHSTLYAHYDEYRDGDYNMNNCLEPGIYYNCVLGRPFGSVDKETYVLRVANLGKTSQDTVIPLTSTQWKFDHDQSIDGWANYNFDSETFNSFDHILDPSTGRPIIFNELYYSALQQNSQSRNQRIFYLECTLLKSGIYQLSFDIAALNTHDQNIDGMPLPLSDSKVDINIIYNDGDEQVRIPYHINTLERYGSQRYHDGTPYGTVVSYNDITTIEEEIDCVGESVIVEVRLNNHSNANWFLFRTNYFNLVEPEMDVIEQTCSSANLDHRFSRILYSTDRSKPEPPFTLYMDWQKDLTNKDLNDLIEADANGVIDKFNEVKDFLDGIPDSQITLMQAFEEMDDAVDEINETVGGIQNDLNDVINSLPVNPTVLSGGITGFDVTTQATGNSYVVTATGTIAYACDAVFVALGGIMQNPNVQITEVDINNERITVYSISHGDTEIYNYNTNKTIAQIRQEAIIVGVTNIDSTNLFYIPNSFSAGDTIEIRFGQTTNPSIYQKQAFAVHYTNDAIVGASSLDFKLDKSSVTSPLKYDTISNQLSIDSTLTPTVNVTNNPISQSGTGNISNPYLYMSIPGFYSSVRSTATTQFNSTDLSITGAKQNSNSAVIVNFSIADGAVTTDKLGANSVTAAKIGSNAVETSKIKDSAVTSAKIASGAVTKAKLGSDIADGQTIIFDANDGLYVNNGSITRDKLEIGISASIPKLLGVSWNSTDSTYETTASVMDLNTNLFIVEFFDTSHLPSYAKFSDIYTVKTVDLSTMSATIESASGVQIAVDGSDLVIEDYTTQYTFPITISKVSILQDDEVVTSKINHYAVTEDKLAPASVTHTKIGAKAVQWYNIEDETIRNRNLDYEDLTQPVIAKTLLMDGDDIPDDTAHRTDGSAWGNSYSQIISITGSNSILYNVADISSDHNIINVSCDNISSVIVQRSDEQMQVHIVDATTQSLVSSVTIVSSNTNISFNAVQDHQYQVVYTGSVDYTNRYKEEVNLEISEVGVIHPAIVPGYGTYSNRPAIRSIGTMYFDTSLGKPIYWNGTNWVDATGTSA